MPKYKIHYSFTGQGYAEIEAVDEDDAQIKFEEGLYDESNDHDTSHTYEVDNVEEIKECDGKHSDVKKIISCVDCAKTLDEMK